MQPATPEYRRLADSILQWEGGDGPEADVLHRASTGAFGRLLSHLVSLIGVMGSVALLTRAVHLVRSEFPFLDPMRHATTLEAWSQALDEALQTVRPDHARDGLCALLATFLGALTGLVGHDLTLILVREIWPELPATPEQSGVGGTPDD